MSGGLRIDFSAVPDLGLMDWCSVAMHGADGRLAAELGYG